MNTNINITMNMNNTATEARVNKRDKQIICLNDNNIFPSISSAARHYGLNINSVNCVCRGRAKTIKGFSFAYIDVNGNITKMEKPEKAVKPKRTKDIVIQKEAIMTAEGKRDGGNCEPCMCITDGLCFTSMTDAAEHYGINVYQISYACKVPGRKAAGREFCTTKDIRLHLNRFSEAINKANSYDILMEKDRMKREIIAKVDAAQDEVYAIEMKLCEAKQALEQARMELANFN